MKTLMTDKGDVALDSRGNLAFLDDLQSLSKRVGQRMRLIRGEWLLDLTIGLPYFDTQFNMNGNVDEAMLVLNREVLSFEEVTAIRASNGFINRHTRKFSYAMIVDTVYGRMEVSNG